MENLKEKCIDMLFNYIFQTYEYERCDAYKEAEIYTAKEKIIEIANTTDKHKLEKIYEDIKQNYSWEKTMEPKDIR